MTRLAARPAIIPWHLPPPDSTATNAAYLRALAGLFAFSEMPRSPAQIALARDRKLDRMRLLLGLLGSPQARFETVLVAGTKGKGSMAAMLASILNTAGLRVGRYTQPHLYSYRERTWADGRYIEEDEVVDLVDIMAEPLQAVEKRREELGPLTTFDVGTALSLLHFSRRGVEVAVVEVGVGGANDATNALEPVLALIGPVGLDHIDTLGSDLVDVGRAKAGVMRRGIDVVVAPQERCVEALIGEIADTVGARVFQLHDASVRGADQDEPFSVLAPDSEVDGLTVPLAGYFQRMNAAMAASAAELLARRGMPITRDVIRDGLRRVHWPGRFQTVVRDPLTIVDGAHNPYAARALAETVRSCQLGRPVTLVLGMSREKDVAATVAELAPLAERVIATRARHARSCTRDELAEVVRRVAPTLPVTLADSATEALDLAWQAEPTPTLITGSLFLVGDVLEGLLA